MTEKELHKLRRQDLLQLLLSQSREAAHQQADLDRLDGMLTQTQESNQRLREKLAEKDAQLEKLTGRLNQKEEELRRLRAEREETRSGERTELHAVGSAAEVSKRLSQILGSAQREADAYLNSIRQEGEAAIPRPAAAQAPARQEERQEAPATPAGETPTAKTAPSAQTAREAVESIKEGKLWLQKRWKYLQSSSWKRS